MSTYTDLKNRVKENVTVGYNADDRTTLQKVKFHNEENEYWGTFNGKIEATDVAIDGGALTEVSVYDSYIKNVTLVNEDGTKVKLSDIGDGLNEISNVTIPKLSGDISRVSAQISSTAGVLGKLDEVSAAVSSEICARISADLAISSCISARFDEKLSAEASARVSADAELSSAVSGLSAVAEGCVEENKHYHIQPVDSEVMMPFKAREFAVNVINNYDLPDAFAKDAATGDVVARIERYALPSRNCEFVPFRDAPDKYLSILGPDAFVFDDGRTQRECKDPSYVLTYNRNGESGAVTDQNFTLSPVDAASGQKLTCVFDCVTQYGYKTNTYGVNDIVIEIPNKPEGSSISREFLFVVKAYKAGAKANIRFVGEDGRDIKWYSDKKPVFEILTGTFVTFKLQEVRDQRFLVVDWNLSRQEQEIDDLYAKVSAETSARISADLSVLSEVEGVSAELWRKAGEHDEQISAISGEVSGLIKRDGKNVSMMGEFTANGMTALSSFLLNQAVFAPTPVEATVGQNWMYRMSGTSELPMVDNAGVSGYIGDNDYVLFKPEKKLVKDVLFSDMNFIRAAVSSDTSAVASRICAWTNGNFAHLSGGNSVSGSNDFVGQLSANDLVARSARLSASATDVFFTDIGASAGSELARLGLSASTNAENIGASRNAVDALSARYVNTFLSSEHGSSAGGCEDLSADNLRLFDEHSYAGEDRHREYRMVLSAGTIVLKKVSRLFI